MDILKSLIRTINWKSKLKKYAFKILFAKYIKKKKIYVDNYLILDSECIFTKKFGLSDAKKTINIKNDSN